ncbi:hypothetical protein V8E36_003291 [Tilletia maclaganii]
MPPKKSSSKSSSSKATGSGSSSASSSSRRSTRNAAQIDFDAIEINGGKGDAPRHSRAPLPASAGSIQRPSTEARFEDLFPDSDAPVAAPAPPTAASSSSSNKRKTPATAASGSDGSSSKRKRTDSSTRQGEDAGALSASRNGAGPSRTLRAAPTEEVVDDFVFTRVDPPVASSSKPEASSKRSGSSTAKRKSASTSVSTAAASTSRPLLQDSVDGETPVIRRNQAFRSGAPATPGSRRPDRSSARDEISASHSRRSKRAETESSLRQTLGIGRPSVSQDASGRTSRRSSLTTKGDRRRSSLRDGRTPAYPHRNVPANELYRHVSAQAGPLPRLKAIFGWILERGVEGGSKGLLEPIAAPPLPDPTPVQPPEDKKGKKGSKKPNANLVPARPPPQPVLNDADRAELAATASQAVLFRSVLSASLSKTVADLTSPASTISDLNWITRPQPGRSSAAKASEGKVPHPRNVAHAALIARLEGSLVGLQAELKRWSDMEVAVEAMEQDNDELEVKLEALRQQNQQALDGQAPNGSSMSTAANHNKGKAPARGSITAEATLAGEEEAWVTSELGEEQQARYRFALSVLRGPDTDGADVQHTPSKDKGRAEETTPSRRKGKRKRDSEAGDLAGGEGHPGARLRDAIAGAEWKIDQLRSSAHTLSQLDAISARYMQAISLRLGDALKDITSDVPGSGPAAVTDVGGSGSQSGSLGALLRGARITNAAAAAGTLSIPEHNGFLSGADPGQDLLRSFVTASGDGASGRRSAPPTARKLTSATAATAATDQSTYEAILPTSSRTSRRSTNNAALASAPESSAAKSASTPVQAAVAAPVAPASPKPSRLPRPAASNAAKDSARPSVAPNTGKGAPSAPGSKATQASTAVAASPTRPSRPATTSNPSTPTRTPSQRASPATTPLATAQRAGRKSAPGGSAKRSS